MRFPLLDGFLTMVWFFLWILWIILMVMVLMDIFRSRDLKGWAKAAWVVFILVLPYAGVFVYLIARGTSMHERRIREAQAEEAALRGYAGGAGGGNGTVSALAELADLRDKGVLSEAEFQQGKAKVLA
jgi:Short C-terminal domain/Phospholipase_D-nuclease N-terminal